MATANLSSASAFDETDKKRDNRIGRPVLRMLHIIVLVLVSCAMLLPFIWLVSSSLKGQHEVFQYPPQWIPNPIRWENYPEALVYRPFALYFKNSLVIALLNVVAVVFSSSFCAYGFARLRFPGRDLWFSVVIATILLPSIITLVPTFVIFTRLGWVNTILPLTVPLFFGGGAFNIFLLRQFFRTIPEELADAARIDGCSEFGIYWRIMMPLAKPALITVAIFQFLASWNDLLGPLIYLRSPEMATVAVGLAGFRSVMATRWDLQMAAATAMIIPVILLFFFTQRYFIKGIVMTGMKG
jgi:ABC-type glycerol-3-phosphate transport system permease component